MDNKINDNNNDIISERYTKSIAFMGSTNPHAFRLGGGEFLEITKIFIGETILNDVNTIIVKNDKIVKYGENGKLFNITWSVCNYFLGWILEWNADIILYDNNDGSYTWNAIAKYDVIMIYSSAKIRVNWSYVDWYRMNYLKENEKQYRFFIEVEPSYTGMITI